MIEHSDFWFVVLWLAAMAFLGAMIYMGAVAIFGYEDLYIKNYKNCIKSGIEPMICDFLYPPLNIQGANWSWFPFP